MDNAERFLDTFNAIESHFKRKLVDDNSTFVSLLERYDKKFVLGPRSVEGLKEYARLRNVIVHSARGRDGRVIADPRPDVVTDIERIRDTITRPKLALEAVGNGKPCLFASTDPLKQVLEAIHKRDYSQFPIYDGGRYQGILTTNCIARWLSAQLRADEIVEYKPIGEVLEFREAFDFAVHKPRSTTAPQAVRTLSTMNERGYRPAALILTNSGKPHEEPLAMIVAADIAPLAESS